MSNNKKYELSDIDLETAAEALSFCDYDDRDNWLAIGMALKSEFGEEAYNDFDRWSQQYDKYKSATVLSVWYSFKKSGITIGTLIDEALKNGFKFDKKEISESDRKRLKSEREKKSEQRKKEQAEADKKVDAWRLKLSDFLTSTINYFDIKGSSDYLKNKKVPGFGVLFSREPMVLIADEEKDLVELQKGYDKFSAFFKIPKAERPKHRVIKKGIFAVPLVDIDGRLWNLQIIQGNNFKNFFPGRTKGCFHIIGNIPATGRFNICLTEGYANGAPIHMALGCPVAVAFYGSNMKAVATLIKNKYGDKINCFAVCADDDKHLEKKGKKNAGMEKAIEAAEAVNGLVISPTLDVVQAVGDPQPEEEKSEVDCLYNEAVDFVVKNQKATTSGVQRFLKIGYNRAARILEQLEANGVVGARHSKGRKVLKKAVAEGSDNG